MTTEYVQERVTELRTAIDFATVEGNEKNFHFYRGQLHVWEEVLRSMLVSA
jgi:hypothetical protein